MRYKFSSLLLIVLLSMVLVGGLALPRTAHAATFTVDDLGDTPDSNAGDGNCDDGGGACTLRAAIDEANNLGGADTIEFSVSGTISPGSPLPPITDIVTLDGTTAPGFGGCRNDHAIELDGTSAGGSASGLELAGGSDGSLVTGLTINRFVIGIAINSSNAITIVCNFIGTDVTGTASIGFGNLVGIQLDSADANSFGLDFSENVISGSISDGLRLLNGSDNNTLIGNFIGVDINGTADLGNGGHGVVVDASNTNIIGSITGTNIISGNANAGIQIQNGATGNMVGPVNFIGLDTNGTTAIPNQDGIVILDAPDNTVGDSGFGGGSVISGNTGNGIWIQDSGAAGAASGNIIETNQIGTDASGSFAIPNGAFGILIDNAANNIIGGGSSASRNVISGNTESGILVVNAGATGNTITNNFIGTDNLGTAAVGNTTGGVFINAGGNTVSSNVISGNLRVGLATLAAGSNTTIDDNLIGVDSSGLAALPNGQGGVFIQTSNNTITNNTISGNVGDGLELAGSFINNVVQSNTIGVGNDGSTPIANSRDGLRISGSSNNTIGGTGAGQGNQIGSNAANGINVVGVASTGNSLLGNQIFDNGTLGIDLNNDGVSPNDGGDGDTSANQGQNWPVLSVAVVSGTGDTIITGSLNSTASTLFRLEFFESVACDGTNGEGEGFIGTTNITTDGGGDVTILATLTGFTANVGNVITATVTDPANNTSEFSNCVVVQQAPYSSVPTPPGPTNIGSAQVGSPVTNATALVISNVSLSLSVTINSLTLNGGDVGDFVINSPPAPFTIDPGDPDVNVSITCTPTAVGLRATQLIVLTDDATQPVGGFVYDVQCTGLPPQPTYASVPPNGSTIVIGTGNVGTPVINSTALQIDNTGAADLTVNLSVSGGQAGEFSVPGGPITITPADAPVDISITCTPTAVGLRTTTLTATTNDPLQPLGGFTYTLNCTGVQPGYGSAPAPGSTIPLTTTEGSFVDTTIVVSETGNATLDVTNIVLSNTTDFTLMTGTTLNIPDGQPSQNITVRCNGTTAGLFSTTVTVTHNAPGSPATYTIDCTVNGIPVYSSAPTPGSTIPLTTTQGVPVSTTIVVSETGTAVLIISNIVLSDTTNFTRTVPAAPNFTIVEGSGLTQDITVQCNATTPGSFSTTVTVTHNAAGSPATYTVTCDVTGVPGYASVPVSGSTINMGAVVGIPATTTIVVSETGTADLDITNIVLSNTTDFTLNAPTVFPASIPDGSGTNVNIVVQCNALAVGAPSTTVTVTHNAPGSPATYTVNCNVTATPTPGYDSNPIPSSTIPMTVTQGTPATTTIVVSETGTADLDITNIVLSNTTDFTLNAPTVFPASIPDGSGTNVNIVVQCNALAVGAPSTTVTITHNAPGSPATYTVNCTVNAAAAPGYDSNPIPSSTIPMTVTQGTPGTTTIVVSETGTADLDITTIVLSNTTDFTLNAPTVFPASIPDGSGTNVNIVVQCNALAVGAPSTTVTVTHNAPGSPATYTVNCTVNAAAAPGYDSNPIPSSTIPMTVTQGTPATTTIVVSETGNAQLDITNIVLSNTTDFTLNAPTVFPASIPDGSGTNVNIVVQCNALAVGVPSTTVTVTHNAPGSPAIYTVNCTVNAAAAPGYGSNPIPSSTIPMTVTQGTPATTTIVVSETGNAQLDITNIVLSNTTDFTLNAPTVFPASIPDGSGTNVNIVVQCNALAVGVPSTTVTVTHNATGSPATYTVNCTVNAPGTPGYGSNPTPGSIITLNTSVGAPVPTNIVVTETGSASLVVSNVNITDGINFALLTPTNFTIADGGPSQNVTVRCNATAAGNFTTTVVITHNAAGSPANYTINCSVAAVPVAGYGSAPAPGSTINVGTALISNLVVTNLIVGETGTSTLSVNQPVGGSITGANAADFAIISGVPPFSIPDGGQNVTVTIRCFPSAVGLRVATLTFTTNAPGLLTVSYTLNCTGVTTLPTATPVGPVVVTVAPTQDPATGPAMASVITVRGLALRSGPYLGGTLLGAVRPGTAYPIQARSNDEGGQYTWYLLTVGNVTAWASGRYLEVIGNVNAVPVIGTVFDQIDNAPDLGVTGVTLSFTDLRRRPSPRSQILLRLEPSTPISIIGRTRQNGGNWWFQVRVGDQVGWIPVFVDIRRGNVNTVPIR